MNKLPYKGKYRVTVSIGFPTAERTEEISPESCSNVDREEWDAMTREKQEEELGEITYNLAQNYLDYGWELIGLLVEEKKHG